MLSEDFDKKMREAADHHHPTYDENAWKGMKKLLDKHMPEEKDDRRRIIFFLLLFLLLGGGAAILFLGNPSGKRDNNSITVSTSNNNNRPVTPLENNKTYDNTSVTTTGNNETLPGEKDKVVNNPVSVSKPVSSAGDKEPVHTGNAYKTAMKAKGTSIWQNQKKKPVISNANITSGNKDKNKEKVKDKVSAVALTGTADADKSTGQPPAGQLPVAAKPVESTTAAPGNTTEGQPVKATEQAKADEKSTAATPAAKKTKNAAKRKSAFFFSLSAGPDVSFTNGDALGRMQMAGGAGIGYSFKGKLSLRSGFYSGRKVYTASPEQYHGSAWFYQYYPNLQKVEADCKVYEIPLALSYHFGKGTKQNWFASAGVSSLLMKEETYDYYYKYTPTGPTVNRSHSTYNENKHFFSVMTLSAGYQRTIGKKFTVIAEPYVKFPLSGVGNGKVMLNSTGVLFSITMNPFLRKDKK